MKKYTLLHVLFITVLLFYFPVIRAQEKKFTVVIDAGHGGKDSGAKGATVNEKVINLAVALKLGNLIVDKHDDIKVVYTRKTDKFIELDERANIANRNKADLFISVHTNAVSKGSHVAGTETFTLGLARTDENLEVAKRENSVIMLEDDYLQKYEGFDPNSSESYIIFEFMQSKHLEQSISLASDIQKAFSTSAKRGDRGVKQAGLLVLRKTSMPSVLVELGFITNREEEKFMKSAAGQNKLATALYEAFAKYKKEYDKRTGSLKNGSNKGSATKPATTSTTSPKEAMAATTAGTKVGKKEKEIETKGQIVYKIQILTSKRKLARNDRLLKGYKNVSYYEDRGQYKYTYGESADMETIDKMLVKVKKDFRGAFRIAFRDGKRL
ncbi:MAG: N-acetylmuramoyl-L-alanine amidase [Tannerellaceae bacterium]|nr:N-acetylmuramoyl-L-alanine amidase [Tannerellaceae bacterium]